MIVEFILYVSDQERSKSFYEKVLFMQPTLNVPGMTEFQLAENVKLGLMPENGIAKIIEATTGHPAKGNGIPRCELYLKVDDVNKYYQRSINAGAKEVSEPCDRDWGDFVGYVADFDGHIIAFAQSRV
jgi:predicted enzyme related to lactoylglutathione lyase